MPNNAATVSTVAASATAVTLFAAGAGNDAAVRTVFNDSTALLYVKFGATASSTDHTVQIPPGGYYEAPVPVYDGLITGIWTSATGSARLTQVDA